MPARRILAAIVLVPFLGLTVYALADVGYVGLFAAQLASPAGWQVFVDLVIALVMVLAWMIPDAQRSGRSPWPWVVATLFLGSIGPLLYLATERSEQVAESPA